jgi:hypothetical protein
MLYAILADAVLVLHFVFVLFVLTGGLLALKWPRIIWLHLPVAAWGAIVECTGWLCPLTPLEQWLRTQAGQPSYEQDFIAQYLLPLLYPFGLTREVQLLLGLIVLLVNGVVYGIVWWTGRQAGSTLFPR